MGLKCTYPDNNTGNNVPQQTRKYDIGSKGIHEIGVGLDCSITILKCGLALVQTTDFFYPLVDDPYVMGKITCANVLSDLYAIGVTFCDNMLMILGIPEAMDEEDRDAVVPLIIKGFKETAKSVGTSVTGGETNITACCIIGGTATSVCMMDEIVMPDRASVGDVLILTKPLGTQAATMVFTWLNNPEKLKVLENVITKEEAIQAYEKAVKSMTTLNRTAAVLMHEFNAHAATDITGFGLLGHAKNLVRHQINNVSFQIHSIPVISKMVEVNKVLNNQFHLVDGKGIETSGGLLISLPLEHAYSFSKKFNEIEGTNVWIIGDVVEGNRTAVIMEDPKIINVT